MSDNLFKVGRRVEIAKKDVRGTIAFVGFPNFASGKWIGVILDEAKGKNDGTVQGKQYFQCEPLHGVFVRQNQLMPLDESGNPIDTSITSPSDDTPSPQAKTSRLTSSRLSLASSRQSLIGSKQSLLGSRTNLTGNQIINTGEQTSSNQNESLSASTPKRASFVETGFVETLKPQFTPGPGGYNPSPILGQSSHLLEDKLNNLQLQQENDNLRSQVKDLNEKLETLKIKRQQDMEKLKDYDKTKLHLDQLLEFKSKIIEAQSSLQRELQRAKQETRDAIEAREKHQEEMRDLAETVEMATMDKEIAEEKAETLQLELDMTKEKIEELQLDLEILKTEMQDKESGTQKEGASVYEIKQLELQNARLREALVRVRDLSAHEKHELQKLQKEFDQKKSEVAELSRTKKKLSEQNEILEQQIVDLQEQVDAALGAEEMVLQLGDAKMSLEDELKQLREELTDLEILQDINEQLIESNQELEHDLREELDLAYSSIRQLTREKEAAYETIFDREQTINKFRDLTQKLQDQYKQLLDSKSSSLKSNQSDINNQQDDEASTEQIIDFKKIFLETKAYTKAIDLELRKIEIQQLQEHIKYLLAYMPDTFMTRGGDNDAINVLLLLPRLQWKSDILISRIRDKFPTVDKIDRNSCVREHNVQRYSFRLTLTFYLLNLQTVLDKYICALNTCKPTTLLKLGENYPEMLQQEKSIDHLLDLLKLDQLDENCPMEQLDKCCVYFNTMFPLLFRESSANTESTNIDGVLNLNQLLHDSMKAFNVAFEAICLESTVIRTIVPSSNFGEIGLLAQHIITQTEQVQQQIKLIKRRLPPDYQLWSTLGFDKKLLSDELSNCFSNASKLIKTLNEIKKESIHFILTNASATQDKSVNDVCELYIKEDKLKDIAYLASDKVYEHDDLGPTQSLKNSLALILNEFTQLAQILVDNEYEINVGTYNISKPQAPIMIRGEILKKEMDETKNLSIKLERRESDLQELRKLLKQKQEELSEMVIRKELAEKKLGNVSKDYESYIEQLQRKLDEKENLLKRKTKEYEETMDHLQADLDSLENEKGELKAKLKLYSKKAYLEATSKSNDSSSFNQSDHKLSSATGEHFNFPAIVKDSPFLLQEIARLKRLLEMEISEKNKLKCSVYKKRFDRLCKIPNFNDPKYNEAKNRINSLIQQANQLIQDYYMTLATPKVGEISSNNADACLRAMEYNQRRFVDLKFRADQLNNKIMNEVVLLKSRGMVQSDFATFPSDEMIKAMNEREPITVAQIKIPLKFAGEPTKISKREVNCTFEQLKLLNQTLLSI